MRSTLVLSSCALVVTCALGLSACGGDSRPYDQIPTSTPALVPPADANDVASGTGAATTTTPTTTDTTGGTGVDTGGTGVDTGGTGDTGGGTGGDTGGGGTPADTGGITPN
ncbi:MAG: hypothetical protein NTZ58_04030 [Solirubrobacterales bacterium]|nr:hypothetical protein [Solirubrobacterales bacterium]